MKTGAIILAAGRQKDTSLFQPLLKIDGITTIRRLIITLKHAGVYPVTVITGEQGDALEKEISGMDVICLRNPEYESSRMFGSIRMGIHYMEDLCERLLILPAKFPLLLPRTIESLIKSTACAACPTFEGKRGHPVLITRALFSVLLAYEGDGGLRAAMELPPVADGTEEIPVKDTGIIQAVDSPEDCAFPGTNPAPPAYCTVDLSLHREETFFHREAARFLELVAHTGSMQTACRQRHISYSKGWKIIKTAEAYLGYPLLSTHSGGSGGGSSCLTPKGEYFLKKYVEMEDKLNQIANELNKLLPL